jgi:hypothetical protein
VYQEAPYRAVLCCGVLQVSSFGDHPLLQPAAAQLSNAMVAVLGPQFTLGSLAYSRCKTLVTDNTGRCNQHTFKAAVLSCAVPVVPHAAQFWPHMSRHVSFHACDVN